MQVLADTPENRRAVNAILQAGSDYNVLVEGVPPTEAHVEEFFTSRPPGYSAQDLFPLGFFSGDLGIGIGGLLRGWNAPNKAMLGLLLLVPEWRGGGRGRAAFERIEALARTWPEIERLRVGVIASNLAALGFWRRMGFIDTGEIKPKYASFIDDIVILEKPI